MKMRSAAACLLVVAAVAILEPLSLSGAETGEEAHRIQARFLAPCCWRESLALHDSPVAKQLRSEIEQMVASGQTESQIVDEYVARYGERILREPRGARFQILTITPIVVLGIGCLLVVRFLLRVRHIHHTHTEASPFLTMPEDDLEWL